MYRDQIRRGRQADSAQRLKNWEHMNKILGEREEKIVKKSQESIQSKMSHSCTLKKSKLKTHFLTKWEWALF